jgi:uncharacterized protein
MAQVFKLYRLQQIDTQIDQLQLKLKQIDAEIKNDSELKEAQENLADQKKTNLFHQQAVRNAESQLTTQRIKFEQNQASLYGGKIRNPKELQDLQNEALAIKRQISSIEDELLEFMIVSEESQERYDQAQKKVEEIENSRQEKLTKLELEKKELLSKLENLQAEKDTVAKTAPENEIVIYNTIRSKRGGIAVALVTDHFCSACGSSVSPALYQLVKSPNHVAYCETCGRILYAG